MQFLRYILKMRRKVCAFGLILLYENILYIPRQLSRQSARLLTALSQVRVLLGEFTAQFQKIVRLLGQAVKTSPFHGGNTGSIPVGVILAPQPSGKAEVCNTFITSSNLVGALFPFMNIAGWSSLVARRAHNPKVVGSNPAPATLEASGTTKVVSGAFSFYL